MKTKLLLNMPSFSIGCLPISINKFFTLHILKIFKLKMNIIMYINNKYNIYTNLLSICIWLLIFIINNIELSTEFLENYLILMQGSTDNPDTGNDFGTGPSGSGGGKGGPGNNKSDYVENNPSKKRKFEGDSDEEIRDAPNPPRSPDSSSISDMNLDSESSDLAGRSIQEDGAECTCCGNDGYGTCVCRESNKACEKGDQCSAYPCCDCNTNAHHIGGNNQDGSRSQATDITTCKDCTCGKCENCWATETDRFANHQEYSRNNPNPSPSNGSDSNTNNGDNESDYNADNESNSNTNNEDNKSDSNGDNKSDSDDID